MTDHLARGTARGIRAFATVTTQLVEEARRRHDCYPVPAAALGRTMTAALLLAANLKTADCLTIRIAGDGPIGTIVADAQATGSVRGYVSHPQVELPLHQGKLAVGQGVGKGMVQITQFTELKQPFTGTAPLVSGEIGEDIANYLLVSEQTPATVSLGVLINPDLTVAAAGGFIVQAMPDVEEEVVAIVERNVSAMPTVSQLVSEGADGASMLARIFAGLPFSIAPSTPVAFFCPCSTQRVESMLISLGSAELTTLSAEGQAEVCCHFCGEKYHFSAEQLDQLNQMLLKG